MRLQRALARAGVASRRRAEDLIRAGRVRVDGAVASIGARVDPALQRITVDDQAVRPTRTTWLALNKPIGYVSSRRDPERRPTVYDLLPKVPGLAYVGRLDVMTTGLLLFTTDGDAVHRLTHPRFAVERTYRLGGHGVSPAALRDALRQPVAVDGRPVEARGVRVRRAGGRIELELTLAEGRHRIVRRLMEALGLRVEWLHRVRYGPVRLGRLAPGRWRLLTPHERQAIDRLHGPSR